MVGSQVTIRPSKQFHVESQHSIALAFAVRTGTATGSAAAASTDRNRLPYQRRRTHLAQPAMKQAPARCVRGGAIGCQSSLSRYRPAGAVPAVRSVSESSSDVFMVNSWFDLPQVSPSLRQPYSTAKSAALVEPPALERSGGGAASPESQPPEAAVTRIHEPEQLTDFLEAHKQQLVVLMCKAHSCRPCKMFMRKYARIAQQYEDRGVCFLEIFGDDTKETRQLMMAMEIRVTPNFRLYRDGQLVHSLTGINETNLRNAVEEY